MQVKEDDEFKRIVSFLDPTDILQTVGRNR